VYNIEMDLREIAGCGMDRIHLVHDSDQWMAPVKTLMNLRVSIKFWKILEQLRN
jgi:hypothetical protein